jgi:hypothetical protein
VSLRALIVALALAAPVGAPASAATRAGLTVWPARVRLDAGTASLVHVANGTARPQVLVDRVAGFALDLRGTPRIVRTSGGTPLLRLSPVRLVVPPKGVAAITVHALRSAAAAPGDHPALVLLTARGSGGAGVGVLLRIGVSVEVRVAGAIRHRLRIVALRVRRGRLFDAVASNRGNVAERLTRGVVTLRLWRHGRLVATLYPRARELLPGTRGVVEFVAPRKLRGRLRAVVAAPRAGGAQRSFSLSP